MQPDTYALATVNGDIDPPRRYTLRLVRDGDRYRWLGEEGEDAEVSAATPHDAVIAAAAAWAGPVWALEFHDLQALAAARIAATPELQPHTAALFYDWPEGAEHWRWIATADLQEIVDWAETVAAVMPEQES